MAKARESTSAVAKSDNVSELNSASKSANVAHLGFRAEIAFSFAMQLGADLSASVTDRADAAVAHMNRSQRSMLAAGLLLASIKSDCAHGEFLALIQERGFEERTAQRAMQYAQFVLSRPENERDLLLDLSPSKVVLLASADPEVVEAVMEDGSDVDIQELGVRALRQRIRELEAKNTDLAVSRDTLEAERDGLAKQLRKRRRDAEDQECGVPVVVADIRAEGADLIKKAELAVASLHPLGMEIVGLAAHSEGCNWTQPTLRLMLSGLVALRLQIDGEIQRYVNAIDDAVGNLVTPPEALAFLDEAEVQALAEEWAKLTSLHSHEAALRAHEREAARPKGKGRPKNAPKAPAAQA